MDKTIILASHGSLANGMLSAVEMILGDVTDIYAFDLEQYETPQAIYEEVENINDDFLLVICDLKGGSVYNQLVQMGKRDNVCIISGMNLGMILELALAQLSDNCREAVKSIVENSKDGVELFDYEKALSDNEKEEDSLW